MFLNRNLKMETEYVSCGINHALKNLRRDIERTCKETEDAGICLCLRQAESETECFWIVANEQRDQLELFAGDELGFIYGIYEISRSILGVTDFWFWNDQQMIQREGYRISGDYHVVSKPCEVRFRGWFVNDEVLIKEWSVDGSREKPWEMVFEALLRCGGNMVIPGTDKNSRKYRKLAADMGLYLTHHHAEPLGAEMFGRVYPQLEASYDVNGEKFMGLWKKSIEEQKDLKVVWNLGFRGQGDRPFWEDAPSYDTPRARGELISKIIRVQYNLIKEVQPKAACCTNLYGEIMELYREGHLELPDDVIKIWADNGFGKMVTRRQGNHNPRIPALPAREDRGKNGIYYHVSFYDLQAANHITMLPNRPEFVERELSEVLECGCRDYWIINCSNVKPHIYYLDFISKMWKEGMVDIEGHRRDYVRTYYGGENAEQIGDCLRNYHKFAVLYGPNEDDHAGEQFPTHVGRKLVSQYMRGTKEPAADLLWMWEGSLKEQTFRFKEISKKGMENYREYLDFCESTDARLSEGSGVVPQKEVSLPGRLFRDSLMMQAQIYFHCFAGAYLLGESLLEAMDGRYKEGFFLAGKAREEYLAANDSMTAREHGKWKNFYANECLTDVKQSAWVLDGYMSYLRNLGEGPDFYEWQRELTYSEEDRRVMLILLTENHLPDLKIYELMKEQERDFVKK